MWLYEFMHIKLFLESIQNHAPSIETHIKSQKLAKKTTYISLHFACAFFFNSIILFSVKSIPN